MSQARQAVQALAAAARAVPARYNLALRYRLDALAHHVEQVAQFLASQKPR